MAKFWALWSYLAKSIYRSNFAYILLAALGACLLISYVAGGLSVSETSESQIVYSLGFSGVILIYGMIVFETFFVRSLFESKELELLCSAPIGRGSVVMSLFVNFALLCLAYALILFAAVAAVYYGKINCVGLIIFAIGILCKALIVSAFCIFVCININKIPFCIFMIVAFYLLTSSLGFCITAMQNQINLRSALSVCEKILRFISMMLPRIDLFANTSWALYGNKDCLRSAIIIVCQSAIYIPMLLCAGILDFRKKDL